MTFSTQSLTGRFDRSDSFKSVAESDENQCLDSAVLDDFDSRKKRLIAHALDGYTSSNFLFARDPGAIRIEQALPIAHSESPLAEATGALLQAARRLNPSGLAAHELEEVRRALGGLAAAFAFEQLRSRGWTLEDGWDRHAPEASNLPVVHPYRLRNEKAKLFVSEPSVLRVCDIRALVELASQGWPVMIEAAGALCGGTLRIVIRPRR